MSAIPNHHKYIIMVCNFKQFSILNMIREAILLNQTIY